MADDSAVVLFGSPHSGGHTALLTERFICGLRDGGCGSITEYNAYELAVQPCVDCGYCSGHNAACINDDMNDVYASIMCSDILVIAAPVYNVSLPSPLKSMVDRMQPFFMSDRRGENPMRNRRRQAVLLLTAGSPSENGELIERQLKWVLRTLNADPIYRIVAADTDRRAIDEKTLNRAYELALELTANGH